ncbi:MAG: hypothetical protein ABWX84_15540 [Nocardioides sp.]
MDTGHGRSQGFEGGLLLLAGCLLLNTLLGPLGTGAVDYPISTSMENQLRGLELVTVLLVVPWLVATAVLTRRGHPAAPLLAIGPAGYAAYMFVQYVLGPEYSAYSWTVLFHLGIASLAGGLVLVAWQRAATEPVPDLTPVRRRRRALLLLGLAGFVLLRYVPAFVGAANGTPIAEEFRDARTFFWSIVLLDLGVVVPATVAAAAALLRGTPDGDRAAYAVLGWFALVPPSVAAMAIVMVVRDDPYSSVPTALLLTAASLAFAAVAVAAFRPLLRARVRAEVPAHSDHRP